MSPIRLEIELDERRLTVVDRNTGNIVFQVQSQPLTYPTVWVKAREFIHEVVNFHFAQLTKEDRK